MNKPKEILFDFSHSEITKNMLFGFFRQSNSNISPPIESQHNANNLQILIDETYKINCQRKGDTELYLSFLICLGYNLMKELLDERLYDLFHTHKNLPSAPPLGFDLYEFQIHLNPFNGILGETLESDTILYNSQALTVVQDLDKDCRCEKLYGNVKIIPDMEQHKNAVVNMTVGQDFYVYRVDLVLFY